MATKAGTALTAGITLPLAALGAISIKAASDFESSFAGVRKTVDATEEEFAQLSQGMRDLSKEIPTNVNALNKIGEAAGQLGVKKADILGFTKVMAQLGDTTNLTADEAATATAQIQNIFGAAGKETDRFGAALVALGNAGASTEKEIIEMSLRIAGAGHQVGLTQAQVLSFASALASVGINAEAGGSAISRVFLKINDAVSGGGKALEGFAKVSGLTSAEFKKAFEQDAATATTKFIAGLGRIKEEGGNVNATLETLVGKNIIIKDTLLRASGAGELLADSLKLGNKAWQENTALTNEAEKRYATFESQFQIFKNTLNDVAITLGNALLPALKSMLENAKPLIQVVADIATWFGKLPPLAQGVAFGIAAIAAAVGPALAGIGLMTTGFINMIPVMSKVILLLTGSESVTAGIALMGSKLSSLAVAGGPILLTVAAVGALAIALYELYKAFKANEQAQGELAVNLANQETSTIRAAKALKDHYNIDIQRGTMSTKEWGEAIAAAGSTASWFENVNRRLASSHKDTGAAVKGHASDVEKLTAEQKKAAAEVKRHTDELNKSKQVLGELRLHELIDKITAAQRMNASESAKWIASVEDGTAALKRLAKETMEFPDVFERRAFGDVQDWKIQADRRTEVFGDANQKINDMVKESGNIAVVVSNRTVKATKDEIEQQRKLADAVRSVEHSAGAVFDALFLGKGTKATSSISEIVDATEALIKANGSVPKNVQKVYDQVRYFKDQDAFDKIYERAEKAAKEWEIAHRGIISRVFHQTAELGKAWAISFGRSIFSGIAGQIFGPLKKGFDDFFAGLLDSLGLNKLLKGLGDKLGGVFKGKIPGVGSPMDEVPRPDIPAIGGGAGSAAGGGATGAIGAAGAVAGAIAGVGVIFQLKRIEGTMNAVEANTRFSYIHLGVMIDQLFWPWDGLFHFIADKIGEQVNQLDAIFNVLNTRSGSATQSAASFSTAAPAMTSSSTVNNFNFEITTNDAEDFGRKVLMTIKNGFKTDRYGVRTDVAKISKENRGVSSSLAWQE